MSRARTASSAAVLCFMAGCQLSQLDPRNTFAPRPKQDEVAQHASLTETSAPSPESSQHYPSRVQPVSYVDAEPPRPEVVDTPAAQLQAYGELTLEQLEQMALTSNPSIAEAFAHVEAARGNWVQVGLPPNTEIGYSGQQLGSRGLAEQNGVYIAQELVRGGKLRLSRAVANQEIAIAEQVLEIQRRRVLTDVHLGYYEVLVAQRRLKFTEQMVQISQEASKAAQALFKAQEVSQADVLRTLVEQQSNEVAFKVSRNQANAAWSKLVAVLGTPEMPQQHLVGELDHPIGDQTQAAMLERLLAESPELHAALFDVERSRVAVDRARAEGVPNIDVQAIIQHDNSTRSSNGALQVSTPIPWLNYNQGGIRAAESQLIAAQQAVGRVELNLQRRLATVFQRYSSARDQVLDYSKPAGILENAKKTLELVRIGYQAGEFGYLDMLTAQRTFAQTNLTYVDAIGELWSATVEIEGLLLKDSLSSEE